MASPDSYIYFIQDVYTERRIPCRFLQLEPEDLDEIMSDAWHGIFTPVWERIVQEEALIKHARKLICLEEASSIQGLLFLGTEIHERWTLDCLLESAPQNQYNSPKRTFTGIGKALVARLIAEHIDRGFHKPLLLETSPRALQFYTHLGALTPPRSQKPNRLLLPLDAASRVLAQVIDGTPKK